MLKGQDQWVLTLASLFVRPLQRKSSNEYSASGTLHMIPLSAAPCRAEDQQDVRQDTP